MGVLSNLCSTTKESGLRGRCFSPERGVLKGLRAGAGSLGHCPVLHLAYEGLRHLLPECQGYSDITKSRKSGFKPVFACQHRLFSCSLLPGHKQAAGAETGTWRGGTSKIWTSHLASCSLQIHGGGFEGSGAAGLSSQASTHLPEKTPLLFSKATRCCHPTCV